ncbi:MAG: DUF6270 domain-containing protein [Lachnospiraceae bacterium]|nr:DUF6270 domain-containing protein [Lachnospiraceae bacterium]
MSIEMDILGSYVSRDIFRHDLNGHYKINRCISNVPITTLYEKSFSVEEDRMQQTTLSSYEKRMFSIQGRKNAVELLKKSTAEYLVIDLADELSSRFLVDDGKKKMHMVYDETKESELNTLFQEVGPVKIQPYGFADMKMEVIEKRYHQFIKSIVKSDENPDGYDERNIIVIESRYAETIINDVKATTYKHPEKYEVGKANEWLNQLYTCLYKYMPYCKKVGFPDFVHSSEHSIRELTPLSYVEDTFVYFLQMIDVVTGMSKVNSMDNLLKEKSLSNKIKTRVLNSSAIYEIGGMKKEIENLKKEVAALRKEIGESEKG